MFLLTSAEAFSRAAAREQVAESSLRTNNAEDSSSDAAMEIDSHQYNESPVVVDTEVNQVTDGSNIL